MKASASKIRANKNANVAGFTLVELSIVLVIIGLIVASVLVGQDLIRQAELRSTVTQFEQFNAASNTFKSKYGSLPGDINGANYFASPANTGGDADGVLEADTTNEHDGEYVEFWTHLGASGTGLIAGNYVGTGATGVTTTDINSYAPQADAGQNWGVYGVSGVNYFIIGASLATAANQYTTTNTFVPIDALSLDDKIDDGRPGRGVVQAREANATEPNTAATVADNTAPSSSDDACTYEDGANSVPLARYNTANTDLQCTLRIRFN